MNSTAHSIEPGYKNFNPVLAGRNYKTKQRSPAELEYLRQIRLIKQNMGMSESFDNSQYNGTGDMH